MPTILETYAGRWATEVLFRDLKQQLGFADSSARKRAAVERTAPFVGYIYTTLVLWFADSAVTDPVATPPIRPWYKHKRGVSFLPSEFLHDVIGGAVDGMLRALRDVGAPKSIRLDVTRL